MTFVGLSFVQRPEDLIEARELIAGRARVLAKLEKPSAIQHLDRIIDLSDAIMVARGDLGVEMPTEDVPVLQRRIVRACRRAGKPVIVATQMLESMVQSPTPTRAEASDVANAVYEGADAVMLSAETAAGAYPVEAVTIMERIIMRAERDPAYQRGLHIEETVPEATEADAMTCRRAAGGGDDRRQRHRHLHQFRRYHPARGARTAGGADPGADDGGSGGAKPRAVVGRASRFRRTRAVLPRDDSRR